MDEYDVMKHKIMQILEEYVCTLECILTNNLSLEVKQTVLPVGGCNGRWRLHAELGMHTTQVEDDEDGH